MLELGRSSTSAGKRIWQACWPTRSCKRYEERTIVELTLIRHGVTEWNASRRFQGRSDIPLSNLGREQAESLARRLRDERFDAIYASDLQRALETASIVAAHHGVDVLLDARLREFDFGEWEGLTWNEIVEKRPHLRYQALTAASLYAPDGGETFEEVSGRVASFLEELATRPHQRVAIVMHAGPLHAAMSVLKLGPQEEGGGGMSFAPASVTKVAMDGSSPRLITLGDVRHLDPPG